MTPEEREAYVNQDVVEADKREFSGSDRLERVMDKNGTVADLFQGIGYLDENSVLYSQIDPMEMECLRLFHGEGMSYNEIAEHMEIRHVSCGRVVKVKKLSPHVVQKLLSSGREALARVYGKHIVKRQQKRKKGGE